MKYDFMIDILIIIKIKYILKLKYYNKILLTFFKLSIILAMIIDI